MQKYVEMLFISFWQRIVIVEITTFVLHHSFPGPVDMKSDKHGMARLIVMA